MSEKAIIFDIQRSSIHDGPGIRTTVFLKGCPLECLWCHNPEALSSKKQLFHYFDNCIYCGKCESVCEHNVHKVENGEHEIDYDLCIQCEKCVNECNFNGLKITGKEMSIDEIMEEVLADRDFYENSGGGITLSGGEPLLHLSFTKNLLRSCRDNEINTCVETSGFVSPEKFIDIFPLIDVLLFDYKITASDLHNKYTGVVNETILQNLETAHKAGIDIFLRCPIIPGINDTKEHFAGIREMEINYPNLKGIEILPYHSIGNNKRTSLGVQETLTELQTTPPEIVEKWMGQLKKLNCEKVKAG